MRTLQINDTHAQPKPVNAVHITPAEAAVISMIAEGLSTKQIAAVSGLTYNTIKNQRILAMAKIGAHTPVEVTRWALKNGYATL